MSDLVGLNVQAPSMAQTMSNLMGLKQQQQQLQLGQQAVQQGGLETQKHQALQNFYKDFDPSEATGEDGSIDLNKVFSNKKFQSAGNAKPLIADTLINIKNKQIQATSALAQLNGQLVTQFGTGLGALASDPDVVADKTDPTTGINPGREKVTEFMKEFGGLDPSHAKIAGMYGLIANHAPNGKLAPSLKTIQLQAQSAAEQQNQQNPRPGQFDTGAHILPTTINPQTGIQTATGQIVNKEFAPGTTNQTGQFVAGGPQTGIAPVAGANPTAAQATAQVGAAKGVTDRVQQAMNAANNTQQAQDALSRAQAILESPDALSTGASFDTTKKLKNFMSSMGIDTAGAEDANSLTKNLARYEGARATAAGLGGTDAARELAHNGSPNTSIDNKALVGVVKQSLATEKAIAAYASKQTGITDPDQLARNENAFRNIPHLIEGYEYGMSRTPEEANEFLKKHGLSKADMAKTRMMIKQFESP